MRFAVSLVNKFVSRVSSSSISLSILILSIEMLFSKFFLHQSFIFADGEISFEDIPSCIFSISCELNLFIICEDINSATELFPCNITAIVELKGLSKTVPSIHCKCRHALEAIEVDQIDLPIQVCISCILSKQNQCTCGRLFLSVLSLCLFSSILSYRRSNMRRQ